MTGEKSGHLLEGSASLMGVQPENCGGGGGGVSKYTRRCSVDSLDNDALLKRGLGGCQQEKGHKVSDGGKQIIKKNYIWESNGIDEKKLSQLQIFLDQSCHTTDFSFFFNFFSFKLQFCG